MTWVPIKDLPNDTRIEGMRVRFKRHVLGYIKSGWNRGLWITPKPEYSGVQPWFPPDGKEIRDIADDLEVET